MEAFFSIEEPTSLMTLACVKWTQKQSTQYLNAFLSIFPMSVGILPARMSVLHVREGPT